MNVLVIGCGKVGYFLARTLREHGHHPTLIEADRERAKRSANELDMVVYCGDGTSIDMLETAGCADTDALIAVTGSDQNNLVACQLAKRLFRVKRTVARVNNPKNTQVLKRLGVDIALSSTDVLARLIEREVDSAVIRQIVPLNQGEASINEIDLPDNYPLDGVRLQDLSLPEESILVSITRGDKMIIPRGKTQLHSGDRIILLCHNRELHQLRRVLKI
ncbi:MAG TPA: TrkA family potassium uptake protein [Firmicutes bacterium]|nr:TrkA family potassium uptake protein [Bacillota bacterium]